MVLGGYMDMAYFPDGDHIGEVGGGVEGGGGRRRGGEGGALPAIHKIHPPS